jgi:hypothetical protein
MHIELRTTESVITMTNILRDHRSALLSRYIGLATLVAITVGAVGILLGLRTVDLYETVNGWEGLLVALQP